MYCVESPHDSAVLNNSTPLKVTKLEVINCTDTHRGQNVSNLFDSPVESRSQGSSLAGPSSSSAGSKPEDSGMQTDIEGLIVLESQLEGNRCGLGGWSPTTVIRVNVVRTAQGVVKSSTYDIQYDDGAVEKGVDIRFLRARGSLACTSTLSDTHCSVLEGLPTTHHTGTPLVNTLGRKGAAEEGRVVAGGDGSDGVRHVGEGGGASSVPGAAAAPSAPSTAATAPSSEPSTAATAPSSAPSSAITAPSSAPSTAATAPLSAPSIAATVPSSEPSSAITAPSSAATAPSSAPSTAATAVVAAAVTGDINVDNAATDGPATPLNRPTLSRTPLSSARAVSYSHSSSRQVAKSNRAIGNGGADDVSAAGTKGSRDGTRQAEANKIIRQSYPSLEDPQYDSDRDFTRSSFKAPLTAAERGPGASRAGVKRSLKGREQLEDFFRDSTPDPLKESGKRPPTDIIKEPLQEQVQLQVPVMRTADTHTHTDNDRGAMHSQGQGFQASEEQSSKIKIAELTIKQQQQLPSSPPLSSLPSSQSNVGRAGESPVTKQVPRALDGTDVLQTRANKTRDVGKTHVQAPMNYQSGKSDSMAPELVRKMIARETVSPVVAAGDAVFDEMEVGSRVEGNYADIGEWFTGRISKKWRDGSYDIQYDDGDREVGVRPPLVRLLKTAQ